MQPPPFVLFTDLDGTLLDEHTYKAKQVTAVLDTLNMAKAPLVFCSSKTFDEQRFYQKKLGLNSPMVVENGSAIYLPEDFLPEYFSDLPKTVGGYSYHQFAHVEIVTIRSIITEIAHKYNLEIAGYYNSDVEVLMSVTGLKLRALQRAMNRHFTESLNKPNLFESHAARRLAELLGIYNLMMVRGGRFWTVQSKFAGKGLALSWFNKALEGYFKCKIPFYAIGDSANDLPMLQVADRAFLVKKHNGTWENTTNERIERINQSGSEGFKTAVKLMLE